jgi:hypothetical protein
MKRENDLLFSLQFFINSNGKEGLNDNKKLGNFIYTNTDIKYLPECEALIICVILGYHKILLCANEQERTSVKKDIVAQLNSNEGLKIDICNRTLNILENVLFESGIPEEVKEIEPILKNILNYINKFLESLTEEKIEEVAKSENFNTYKKLFKDLELV